jgi:hypothetical protein
MRKITGWIALSVGEIYCQNDIFWRRQPGSLELGIFHSWQTNFGVKNEYETIPLFAIRLA